MAPHILSFCIGFLSLSQEILWIRLISFNHSSTPFAFSFVLGCFILGISIGSSIGKKYCESCDYPALQGLVWKILALGAVADILAPWVATAGSGDLRTALEAGAVFTTAAIKSILFPIAHHLGTRVGADSNIGSSVSRVYVANIAGSSLGPVVTGFILLDWVSTQQAFIGIAAGQALLGLYWAWYSAGQVRWPVPTMAMAAMAAVAMLRLPEQLLTGFLHRNLPQGETLLNLVENTHGVIHTVSTNGKADAKLVAVYGGNVYDGTTNITLENNTNGINRAYILAAVHPAPRRVLVIGLSTGAWTKVLAGLPNVEQIDVVEINPGYLQLIAGLPHLSSLLRDPRIRIHVDDGRRWMRRNPNERFDLIVQNTSHHWRAYATVQLSHEFQKLAESRLQPGGIMAYNSTLSMDAFKTTADIFRHSAMYGNLVLASDRDFLGSLDKRAPFAMAWEGNAIFNPQRREDEALVAGLFATPFVSYAAVARNALRPHEQITDANLITEFKFGLGL